MFAYRTERDGRVRLNPILVVQKGVGFLAELVKFPVLNAGGTYRYHPHAHEDTARQTYLGLASCFLVGDEEDRRLNET